MVTFWVSKRIPMSNLAKKKLTDSEKPGDWNNPATSTI